jgi:hypothetical protein
MMVGWQTLNNQNGGNGKRYNNLLHKGDKILDHEIVVHMNERHTKTKTLNFCNANMAHPSPTIYG